MTGSVLQVSVSRGGVPKRAVAEASVSSLGIDGDAHAHPDIHGGQLQALLLISSEALAEVSALGFQLYPGALGENITTRGLDCRAWRPGQRWRVGQLLVEFTKRRSPCNTLSVYGPGIQAAIFDAQCKAGDASSPRWGLSGFYASVIQPGIVRPGDPISFVEQVV